MAPVVMPSCARIAAIDRSILPRSEGVEIETGKDGRLCREHGAADPDCPCHQSRNSRNAPSRAALDERRTPAENRFALVVLQLPLAIDDLHDHACALVEAVVVSRAWCSMMPWETGRSLMFSSAARNGRAECFRCPAAPSSAPRESRAAASGRHPRRGRRRSRSEPAPYAFSYGVLVRHRRLLHRIRRPAADRSTSIGTGGQQFAFAVLARHAQEVVIRYAVRLIDLALVAALLRAPSPAAQPACPRLRSAPRRGSHPSSSAPARHRGVRAVEALVRHDLQLVRSRCALRTRLYQPSP